MFPSEKTRIKPCRVTLGAAVITLALTTTYARDSSIEAITARHMVHKAQGQLHEELRIRSRDRKIASKLPSIAGSFISECEHGYRESLGDIVASRRQLLTENNCALYNPSSQRKVHVGWYCEDSHAYLADGPIEYPKNGELPLQSPVPLSNDLNMLKSQLRCKS